MTDDVTSEESPQRRERLIYVSVDQLTEGPHAPAAVSVPEDFIQSLKTYGVLHPLLVRPGSSGYEVIAGFKRLRGAKAAKLKEVPVRVYRAEDASLAPMYAASNTGSTGKSSPKTSAPLSSTDGISSGTLGGFLEDELGRKNPQTPYVKIVGISAVILIIAWIALIISRNLGGGSDAPRDPDPVAPEVTSRDKENVVRPTPRPIVRGSSTDWQDTLSDIDGISVQLVNSIPRVVFAEPVFSQLTTIDPEQKSRLVRLVNRILDAEPRSVIMVIGHTDNDPIRANSRYRSNTYLSELRANEVITFLTESGTAPARQLKPVASGADDPPFSNDNAADKVRNRTVTLEILQPQP